MKNIKTIETEIIINASKQQVWDILLDFKAYPDWNPFIRNLTGHVQVGEKLHVEIQPPESKAMKFKPVVKSYKEYEEFTWLGHLLFSGLFDGMHQFRLVEIDNKTTLFQQSESFSGVLVPVFTKMLDDKTKKGFELMNERLKVRAEQATSDR